MERKEPPPQPRCGAGSGEPSAHLTVSSQEKDRMANRTDIKKLIEIPNVGPARARDLAYLNIVEPFELIGKDPYKMYEELCQVTGKDHDPCVIDVFISAVKFMEGESPQKWWHYTEERKKALSKKGGL